MRANEFIQEGPILNKALTVGGHFLQGTMTVFGIIDAISRWNKGDKTGAVIATLSTIGYLVPMQPAGMMVATGFDLLNYLRDHPEIVNDIGSKEKITRAMAAANQRSAIRNIDTPANPSPYLHPERYPSQ
jgi:hypothetical protein